MAANLERFKQGLAKLPALGKNILTELSGQYRLAVGNFAPADKTENSNLNVGQVTLNHGVSTRNTMRQLAISTIS